MDSNKIVLFLQCLVLADGLVHNKNSDIIIGEHDNYANDVFNGVYTECFMHLSYSCLQQKTLLYLKELNTLSEVSVIGDYVKFVKINASIIEDNENGNKHVNNSEELAVLIDKAIDNFFNNHIIKFSALGRDISMSRNVEEFVGRKKRKGGGGGGGGGGGDHGGDHDFGKKKMMMMAMMCMKMKLMMMVPAMMGMMGMMSFKGMMFSMMSFMISKMMLLMKLLEKKGGAGLGGGGGGGGGGADGGWAAGGGGGGAWMPAGGQDYAGGGGYDANGQWQSRSILNLDNTNKPVISYITPVIRYNDKTQHAIVETIKTKDMRRNGDDKPKSRRKRDLIDMLQNSYIYWVNKILGIGNNRRNNNVNHPKQRIVNGVKYIFYPVRPLQKIKMAKDVKATYKIKNTEEEFKPIITAEDFNKGEIVEGAVESRMNKKKFHKMKDSVNDTVDDNPWE